MLGGRARKARYSTPVNRAHCIAGMRARRLSLVRGDHNVLDALEAFRRYDIAGTRPAKRTQCLAHDLLGVAARVHLGVIEKVHTGVAREPDGYRIAARAPVPGTIAQFVRRAVSDWAWASVAGRDDASR